jgi:ABC-2 type transport system permease protein
VVLMSLRTARRGLLWWTLGLIGLVAMMVAIYPSLHGNEALERFLRDSPEALKAFTEFGGVADLSPAGYLGREIFALMGPLLLLVAGIGGGAGAIAGEEERGTLDLLLSHPVSRRRLALEKLGALAAELTALTLVLWLSLLVGCKAVGMHISTWKLAAGCLSLLLVAVGFAAIAFLVGVATGHRARAIALTTALAVAAYLVNTLAPLTGALKPIRPLSPFYHYAAGDPLRHGLAGWHVLVLAGITVVAAALAPLVFERRDLAA